MQIRDVTGTHSIQIQARKRYSPKEGGWVAEGINLVFTDGDADAVRFRCTSDQAREAARLLVEAAEALDARPTVVAPLPGDE